MRGGGVVVDAGRLVAARGEGESRDILFPIVAIVAPRASEKRPIPAVASIGDLGDVEVVEFLSVEPQVRGVAVDELLPKFVLAWLVSSGTADPVEALVEVLDGEAPDPQPAPGKSGLEKLLMISPLTEIGMRCLLRNVTVSGCEVS